MRREHVDEALSLLIKKFPAIFHLKEGFMSYGTVNWLVELNVQKDDLGFELRSQIWGLDLPKLWTCFSFSHFSSKANDFPTAKLPRTKRNYSNNLIKTIYL
jgi:hypothetical protein